MQTKLISEKLKKDLPVKIGFDAFPDIEMEGVVTDVANVGETKSRI